MPQCGIYQIMNTITGDCYVGSSVDFQLRKARHLRLLRQGVHHSPYLQNAYNKYGESVFVFNFLEDVVRERNALFQREGYWIRQLQPQYNVGKLAATALGVKRSETTRQRLSKAALNRPPHPAEVIERIAAKRRGTKQSKESNRKRSESLKANNRVWTDEQKAQIAAKNRETWNKKSAEEKRAITQKRSPEVLEAQSERFRQLGKDPARIEASRRAAAKAKQQRDEAKQQAKMLQKPLSEEEKLEKKRQRYAFTQTPEYKQKIREARKAAEALGKPHGGPKPDLSKPRSRHRIKAETEKLEQQTLFDDSSSSFG